MTQLRTRTGSYYISRVSFLLRDGLHETPALQLVGLTNLLIRKNREYGKITSWDDDLYINRPTDIANYRFKGSLYISDG